MSLSLITTVRSVNRPKVDGAISEPVKMEKKEGEKEAEKKDGKAKSSGEKGKAKTKDGDVGVSGTCLCFLGTGSATPSVHRNVSGVAMRTCDGYDLWGGVEVK
jgi:hypothetical protein